MRWSTTTTFQLVPACRTVTLAVFTTHPDTGRQNSPGKVRMPMCWTLRSPMHTSPISPKCAAPSCSAQSETVDFEQRPKIINRDPVRRANFIAAVDGLMVEGGAYSPEFVGDPRKLWLNNIHFVEDMNAVGKGVYLESAARYPDEASIPPAYIRFTLASYLLAKGRHAGVRIYPAYPVLGSGIFWPAEFQAASAIGTPCALMSQVAGTTGSENGLFMREYTGGVSLVNASETTTFSATLPPGSYKDLYNGGVGSPVTLPPTTGLVLMKTSGSACSNSPPVTSAVSVTNITAFTATVNWVTNRPTDGQVEFIGVCPSTGCLTSLVSTLDTTHAINVSGLSPNTAYTYRIRSKDAAGNLVITNNLTFTTASNDTIPPVLSSISAINVTSTDATINWTTNELADGQIEFVSPCPAIGCLTSLVSGLTTSHAITVGSLSANTSYTYRVRSKDAAGNLTVTTNQAFTTAVTGGAIGLYSLWNNAVTPANTTELDSRAIELGVKFKSDIAGAIYGIRFYKGPQNTGVHNVSLWTASGTLLARSASTTETATGWQQVSFSSPVNISANTTYVASYHTTSGFYSANDLYFGREYNNAPLHALADEASGGNGLWQTASAPTFPTQAYRSDNFWVDVVFGPTITPPPVTQPPVTPPPPTGGTYTLFNDTATPSTVTEIDSRAIELGMKFTSDIAGAIYGIRFYKGPQNTGIHNVSLWTTSGTLLARSQSTTETASGWQQVNFASPVNIAASTTYVASYHTTSGFYSVNESYFTSQYDKGASTRPGKRRVGRQWHL